MLDKIVILTLHNISVLKKKYFLASETYASLWNSQSHLLQWNLLPTKICNGLFCHRLKNIMHETLFFFLHWGIIVFIEEWLLLRNVLVKEITRFVLELTNYSKKAYFYNS